MRISRTPSCHAVGLRLRLGLILLGLTWVGREAVAQIDPYERRLLHLGYNQSVTGRSPLSVYAFYLHNQTNFQREDWTLRAAVAPVWLESELGWKGLLGEDTDVGLIFSGGGFARTYNEIRLGDWKEGESFTGHGFTVGSAVYHRFNPGSRLPLNGILSATAEGSLFTRDDETDGRFELPQDHVGPVMRGGLRLGGQEPDFNSRFAFEASAWYEGRWRPDNGVYGFNGDRVLEEWSHRFWARLLARLTSEDNRHDLEFALTMGTGLKIDRLSSFRAGGMLPFASEFPLMIPGYNHQELSARNFALLSGRYSVGLTPDGRWRAAVFGATSSFSYLRGLEYPGRAHSGVGGGVSWRSPRKDWIISAFYGLGFDAVRDGSLGGQMVGLVMQYDFQRSGGWERSLFPSQWSQDVLRIFGR